MSKSFEKEYKELAQSKLPDLWDRIEAGLSEKKPVSVPITINEEAINNETTIKKADSNKVLVFFLVMLVLFIISKLKKKK